MSKLKCIVMFWVCRCQACTNRWDFELAVHSKSLLQDLLGYIYSAPIIRPLLCGPVKVCLGIFKRLLM